MDVDLIHCAVCLDDLPGNVRDTAKGKKPARRRARTKSPDEERLAQLRESLKDARSRRKKANDDVRHYNQLIMETRARIKMREAGIDLTRP
jgi:chromosome segregation ATPase